MPGSRLRAVLRQMSSSTTAVPTHEIRDFPDWVPAMVVKELRQGLRARMFVVPFVLLQAFACLALVQEYLAQDRLRGITLTRLASDNLLPGMFWSCAWLFVGLIMPFRCMGAMTEELREKSADLLLLGGLSRMRIVQGKWLVQLLLSLLTLLSLAPYMLARYFLGAVDLTETLLHFLSVLGCAGGVSGVVIGASGYRGTATRIWIIAVCSVWLLVASGMSSSSAAGLRYLAGGSKVSLLWALYLYAYGLGVMVLYGMLGLQLARGHMKLALFPWELSPTRTIATIMFTAPFILVCGAVATCGAGAILILILMIFVVSRYDRRAPLPPGLQQPGLSQPEPVYRPPHGPPPVP